MALIDTNVLVYRYDPRFPRKQSIATELLRSGLEDGTVVLPHQAILEFVAATTRDRGEGTPLLAPAEAHREAEELLRQFRVLYPTESVLRLAIRGAAAYQLSWFDAHLWACAENEGIRELITEDFEHGRWYGGVRTVDPFRNPGRAD